MLNLDDYLNAPCGMGPLADEWKDNPHRLIYDLVHEIKILHPLKTKQQRIKISYSSKAGAYYLASEGKQFGFILGPRIRLPLTWTFTPPPTP
jgi:hypothetical protein